MLKRMIVPLVFGIVGTAILVALGIWQVQRLEWKEGVLADIEARIAADPVPVPADPDPEADRYLPVRAEGDLTGERLQVLASVKRVGPVHRVVEVFETDGRRLLLDRGYIPADEKDAALSSGRVTVSGNLHWPDETDSFTPAPDRDENLWFAREVPLMAEALATEPLLIVAREVSPSDPLVTQLPVDTSGIPNDHLEYAITWFSLAAIWAGMTGWLLWRIRRRTV